VEGDTSAVLLFPEDYGDESLLLFHGNWK